MIKVGIIGGAGYTAGELIRILINHPFVSIQWIHSSSNAGQRVDKIHSGLEGDTDLLFASEHPLDLVDVVFLCAGHGFSAKFWSENKAPENLKIIDLAQDFRDESEGYVYGLPELNREQIRKAHKIANPGCFATAIQLALLPLAASKILPSQINITALTGSTGAGVKPGATTHFSWRDNNISVYKPFSHQHLKEIGMTLSRLQPDFNSSPTFIPMRGDFARGIFAVFTLDCNAGEEEIHKLYADFYADDPFTHLVDADLNLKQVVNTNKCLIQIKKHEGKLLICSAIDNLLKGASGQAVQNMNLMFSLPEDTALRLKASAF